MEGTITDPRLSADDQRRLDDLYGMIGREAGTFVGYPCNAVFDYSPLFRFLAYPVNNVGDPFVPSNFHLNSHEFEREVLGIFQKLTSAPADSFWGYVTSGGTEGNMYGIFLAQELFPEGLVYFSEDTHYSVSKILRCLRVRNVMIKSQPDGCIDLDDLRETIRIHRDVPPIVFANVGTTMKGAVDDLEAIQEMFRDLAIQDHYVHADAAFSGMILPFVDDPQPWDFRTGIDSMSISGHKMIGSPLPCGVVLAKKSNVDRIARRIEYVGTLDTTIAGSRNAITPLFLWYAFRTIGMDGFRGRLEKCFEMADYAIGRLVKAGRHAWRHRNSLTVVFDRPSKRLVGKWQLAAQGDVAHLITMPHVGRERIDQLVDDVAADVPEPSNGDFNP